MCDCIPSCILFYDDFIVTTNRQFFVLLCHFKFKAVVYKYFCVNYFYSCIVYCFISLPVDSRKCIMNCYKVKFQWNFHVVSKSDLRCLKFYIRVKVHEAHQRNKMELQPSIYKCKAWQCLARSHVVLHHNYYLQQTNNVKFLWDCRLHQVFVIKCELEVGRLKDIALILNFLFSDEKENVFCFAFNKTTAML